MRSVRLLSPLAAIVVALGGCGDSEDEATTSTTRAVTSTTTVEATATPDRRELEKELRRLLAGGDTSVDADCAIEKLRGTLSDEMIRAAIDAADAGEEIPEEAVDAAYAAGQECAGP